MASKYDAYWLSIMDNIRDGIERALKTGKPVIVDIHGITQCGVRNSWYGTVKVTPQEITGGEMAHAMSLGKMVKKQEFLKDMNDVSIRFKISKSLNLEIEVENKEFASITENDKEEKSYRSERLNLMIK